MVKSINQTKMAGTKKLQSEKVFICLLLLSHIGHRCHHHHSRKNLFHAEDLVQIMTCHHNLSKQELVHNKKYLLHFFIRFNACDSISNFNKFKKKIFFSVSTCR